jgi:sterol desaturase/sphingolipid hydroxylase (fatty acid hydroxylase superfamily)
MPNPIEILLDPISLTFLAIYGALVLYEAVAPGRELPRVPGWRARGLASFAVYFYLSSYLPLLWDGLFAEHRLLDLTGWGLVGGAAAGVLAYELGVYVWHRALHGSKVLWRGLHQMHHSAERLDTYGAFYFSPLDMAGWTLLASLVLTLGLGLTPQAATSILLFTTFIGVFPHTNVKTPQWLGYLIQRPESHTVHHARGVHAYNYSDLPVFDLIFGTFRNPKGYEQQTGFYDGASARVGDMLVFRDVTTPAEISAPVEASARLVA